MENFEIEFQKKLQNYSHVWNREERMLHLVEEVGEFAEIILQYNGSKEPKKDIRDVKVALADILEDVYALAILYGIRLEDLTKELIDEKGK